MEGKCLKGRALVASNTYREVSNNDFGVICAKREGENFKRHDNIHWVIFAEYSILSPPKTERTVTLMFCFKHIYDCVGFSYFNM